MHHRQLTRHNGLDQQYFIECHIDGSPNCRRQVRDQGKRKIIETWYRGMFLTPAPALQTASETDKIAFAPSWKTTTIIGQVN
jgi:hypothetical protein